MNLKILGAAMLALSMLPAVAEAAVRGYATTNVNMRSGPSTGYPAVVVLPAGTPVMINGCLQQVQWCDVTFTGGRGWVAGRYIQAMYRQNRVYVEPRYYRGLGVPTIQFDMDNYWRQNYRGRDFYRDRDRWRGYDWNGSPARRPDYRPEWDRRPNFNRDLDERPGYRAYDDRPGYRPYDPRPGYRPYDDRSDFDRNFERRRDFDRDRDRDRRPDINRDENRRPDRNRDEERRPERNDDRRPDVNPDRRPDVNPDRQPDEGRRNNDVPRLGCQLQQNCN